MTMIDIAIARATRLTKVHEGLELKVYPCPAGFQTIGFGRNLEGKGITHEEAIYLLQNDLKECASDLSNFSYFEGLAANRKAALLDMRYNLGPGGFRKFKRMHAALKSGDYEEAAEQMLDSKWADQTKGRALRLAHIIKTGVNPSEGF